MPTRRPLSESEFTSIRDGLIAQAPPGLSETEFTRWFQPRMSAELGRAEYSPPPVQGSALSRGLSNAWDVLNPANVVKPFIPEAVARAAGASPETAATFGPVNTLQALGRAHFAEAQKAAALAREGRYVEAAGHGFAAGLPVLGPVAAQAGEQIGAGDWAGGGAKAAALIAPVVAEGVLRARAQGRAANEPPILERQARDQVSLQVLGPANPKYKGKAAGIAQDVLDRGLSGSRDVLRQTADEGMADAAARIDAGVLKAGGPKAPIEVAPIIDKIRSEISDLQDSHGVPLSEAAGQRIGALDQNITRLRAMGGKAGVALYEDLKKFRDEHGRIADEGDAYARIPGNVLTDDAWASKATRAAVREAFAERSPETAAANADYHFFKTLNDVLDPVKGRPKSTAAPTGVTGGARTTGAVMGAVMGSRAMAFIMGGVLPWIKDRLASPEWQLASAQQKMRLAESMRKGDIGGMRSAMVNIEKAAAVASGAQTTTSPSEYPSPLEATGQ